MQTRRQFVTAASSAAAAVILAPEALANGGGARAAQRLARGGRFREGVMSGEPTTRGISLWTRVDDLQGRALVELEVARDRSFRNVVARRRIATTDARDHNVKATVRGLRPHEQYYYRFSTATEDGPVGRFRTALPADSRQPVKFAFYSCQEYSHGFYNAHEVLAREDDLDFVVCLGDYIYAETYTSTEGADRFGVRDDRIGRTGIDALRVAVSLEDYRRKYRLYRSDRSLQRSQAAHPTIMLWDDHEVQNNYVGTLDDGGLEEDLRFSRRRQAAAYRAFFEATPYTPRTGTRLYRSLDFGRTVELFALDSRQYRDDQPCGDAVARACPELDRPRDYLGRTQLRWLKDGLRDSRAAWKVIANPLMMMPFKLPGGFYTEFDSWSGYPRERQELLTHIRDRDIEDVVFVTGDIHAFFGGDVWTGLEAGPPAALEFVGGSITSQGLTERSNDANPVTSPAQLASFRSENPWLDAIDLDHHGYGKITATRERLDCELVRVPTIKRRTRETLPSDGFRYRVARGQRSVKGVNGPAAVTNDTVGR